MNKIIKIGVFTIIVVALLSFLIAPVLQAATIRGGVSSSLSKEETIDGDLYLAGSDVEIDGTVNGDLITAGEEVFIKGVVKQDVNVVGSIINISGEIEESVRAAGAEIIIDGPIKGDVVAFGAVIKILSNADIKGDLLVKGGEVLVRGKVAGSTHLSGNNLTIDGNTNGVILESSKEITIGPNAVINKNLTYVAPSANLSEKSLISGQINKKEVQTATQGQSVLAGLKEVIGVISVFYLISLILAAILIIKLFKEGCENFSYHSVVHLGGDFLRGLVILVSIPFLILLLLTSGIGGFVGLIILLGFGFALAVARILAGILFGAWLFKTFSRYNRIVINWKSATIGIISLYIIGFIPFVGFLTNTFFFLAAFGGFLYQQWRHYQQV